MRPRKLCVKNSSSPRPILPAGTIPPRAPEKTPSKHPLFDVKLPVCELLKIRRDYQKLIRKQQQRLNERPPEVKLIGLDPMNCPGELPVYQSIGKSSLSDTLSSGSSSTSGSDASVFHGGIIQGGQVLLMDGQVIQTRLLVQPGDTVQQRPAVPITCQIVDDIQNKQGIDQDIISRDTKGEMQTTLTENVNQSEHTYVIEPKDIKKEPIFQDTQIPPPGEMQQEQTKECKAQERVIESSQIKKQPRFPQTKAALTSSPGISYRVDKDVVESGRIKKEPIFPEIETESAYLAEPMSVIQEEMIIHPNRKTEDSAKKGFSQEVCNHLENEDYVTGSSNGIHVINQLSSLSPMLITSISQLESDRSTRRRNAECSGLPDKSNPQSSFSSDHLPSKQSPSTFVGPQTDKKGKKRRKLGKDSEKKTKSSVTGNMGSPKILKVKASSNNLSSPEKTRSGQIVNPEDRLLVGQLLQVIDEQMRLKTFPNQQRFSVNNFLSIYNKSNSASGRVFGAARLSQEISDKLPVDSSLNGEQEKNSALDVDRKLVKEILLGSRTPHPRKRYIVSVSKPDLNPVSCVAPVSHHVPPVVEDLEPCTTSTNTHADSLAIPMSSEADTDFLSHTSVTRFSFSVNSDNALQIVKDDSPGMKIKSEPNEQDALKNTSSCSETGDQLPSVISIKQEPVGPDDDQYGQPLSQVHSSLPDISIDDQTTSKDSLVLSSIKSRSSDNKREQRSPFKLSTIKKEPLDNDWTGADIYKPSTVQQETSHKEATPEADFRLPIIKEEPCDQSEFEPASYSPEEESFRYNKNAVDNRMVELKSEITVEPGPCYRANPLNNMLQNFANSISSYISVKTEPEEVLVKKEIVEIPETVTNKVVGQNDTPPTKEGAKSRSWLDAITGASDSRGLLVGQAESNIIFEEVSLEEVADDDVDVNEDQSKTNHKPKVPKKRTRRFSKSGSKKCFCGRSFSCPAKLKDHMHTHSNVKPWACSVCGKCFSRQDVVRRHEETHTKKFHFKCDFCKKPFRFKCDLNRHKRVHSGEKRFQCEVCRKYFGQRTGLVRHLSTHDGEKPFTCNICKNGFVRKSVLIRHITRRHKSMKETCPVCGKGFKTTEAQIAHLQTHPGVKKNQCRHCLAPFSSPYWLTRHQCPRVIPKNS